MEDSAVNTKMSFWEKFKLNLKRIFFISDEDVYLDDEGMLTEEEEEKLKAEVLEAEEKGKIKLLGDLVNEETLLDRIKNLKLNISRLEFCLPEEYLVLSKEVIELETKYRELSISFSKTNSYELTTSYDPDKSNDLSIKVLELEEKVGKLVDGELKFITVSKRLDTFIELLEDMYRRSITYSDRKLHSNIRELISQANDALEIVTNDDISVMYSLISSSQKEDLSTKIFVVKYLIEKTKIRCFNNPEVGSYFEGNKKDYLIPLVQDLRNLSDKISNFEIEDKLLSEKLKSDIRKLQEFNYLPDPVNAFSSKKFWADLFALEDAIYIPKKKVMPKEKTVKSVKQLEKVVDNNMTKKIIDDTLREKAIYLFSEELPKYVSKDENKKLFALSVVLQALMAEPLDAKKLLNLILLFELQDTVFGPVRVYSQFDLGTHIMGDFSLKEYDPSRMTKKKESILKQDKQNFKYYEINFKALGLKNMVGIFEETLKLLKIDYTVPVNGVVAINQVYFGGYNIQNN